MLWTWATAPSAAPATPPAPDPDPDDGWDPTPITPDELEAWEGTFEDDLDPDAGA